MILFTYEYPYYIMKNMDTGEVLDKMQEVALAYSYSTKTKAVILKWGSVFHVTDWVSDTRQVYRDGGYVNMANELHMIVGAFQLAEINKCIEICDYINTLLKNTGVIHETTCSQPSACTVEAVHGMWCDGCDFHIVPSGPED